MNIKNMRKNLTGSLKKAKYFVVFPVVSAFEKQRQKQKS